MASDVVHDDWVEPLARSCKGAPIPLLADMLRNLQNDFVWKSEEPGIVPMSMKVVRKEESQGTIDPTKLSNIWRAKVGNDVDENPDWEVNKAGRWSVLFSSHECCVGGGGG
jgi:hypothetical protein